MKSLGTGVAAIGAALAAGCGGGGGGGGGAQPQPPPPPAATVPLVLSTKNFAPAAQLTVTVAEALLQLGMLAADTADEVKGVAQASIPCLNGGTVDLSVTDKNADGQLNNGDIVQAKFNQCYQASVNDVVNGEMTLTLGAAAATTSLDAQPSYAGELEFASPFSIGADTSPSIVSGGIAVSLVRDSISTILSVSSGTLDNFNISVVVNGTTYNEDPRSVQLNKKLDFSSATVELRLAMTEQSQALGGQVILSTQDYVGGYFNIYPTIGAFSVTGAAGSAARLRVGGQYVIPGNDQSTVDLSSDGFQTISASQMSPWASFTAGFLWWEPLSNPNIYPNGYAPQVQNGAMLMPALLFTRPVSQGTRSVNLPIYVQYSAPIATAPAQFVQLTPVAPQGPSVPISVTFEGARLVITPQQALQTGTLYDLSMDGVGPTILDLQFTAQ